MADFTDSLLPEFDGAGEKGFPKILVSSIWIFDRRALIVLHMVFLVMACVSALEQSQNRVRVMSQLSVCLRRHAPSTPLPLETMMSLKTRVTAELNIQHPILLAPMAGVSGGALAAAVSSAGGLGVIGGGYGDKEWLQRELIAAGNTPVAIGFISWALQKCPDMLNVALARDPKAIFLSFGDIRSFAPAVRKAGIPLIAQVQTVAQAKAAVSAGADFIVAQGTEAGGHGGVRSTLPLIPAVVDAVGNIPVIAAGGIADGRGLAAALMLGAAGVLCGTAFFASRESLTHPNMKRAAFVASGDDTVRSSAVDIARGIDWPAQWTIRTLKNGFTERWSRDLDGLRRNVSVEQPKYSEARDAGNTDIAAVIVGEAVDFVHGDENASDIITRIVSEAETLLRNTAQFLD
jgi:nitronate monooxygenase